MDRAELIGDVMSSAALGSRPTQPGAGLPPVQADQSSLERETMLPIMGLSGLSEATIGSETGGVGDAVTGRKLESETPSGEIRRNSELGKVLEEQSTACL
ncbi:hypothetical protein MHU86_4521 [Fragilaria crotonensis]|nr:hypothetical protein MHU86_4521 [Fragilaria crotonensis]